MNKSSNDSFSAIDIIFLSLLLVMVTVGWVFVIFSPTPPNAELFYFIMIYGPPGWMITTWLMCVWGFVIYHNLFGKRIVSETPAVLYRVDDEYDRLLKEAHKEIEDFLKETM